jgi:hypothetical protein
MRSPLDLLELPYSFSQEPLLLAEDFRKAAHDRGVALSEDELEALHRARVLVPLFRLSREGRPIVSALRGPLVLGRQLAHWSAPSLVDLIQAQASEQLHDPEAERLVSIRQRRHKVRLSDYEEPVYVSYDTSVYVYSRYQLMALSIVGGALGALDRKPRLEGEAMLLKAASRWKRSWQDGGRKFRDLAIAASAIEALYYSRIVGKLRLAGHSDIADFDQFQRWRDGLEVTEILEWLGVDADWLKKSGSLLLYEADRIDPLRDWSELVARAEPDKWARLRGSARSAMDMRIGAELFLGYHDDLTEAGKATPLEETGRRFDHRLKRKRQLDAVLTEFGLSPHPRLVLVVEGATEVLHIHRAMEMLGISTDEDFISVQDAEGVDKDLKALLAFMAPRVEPDDNGRHLDLIRPATRFLVVFDPEGTVGTPAARRKRRDGWVDRIHRAIPGMRNNQAVREQVESLVELITWNTRDETFEFAHFTDREIAAAILRLYSHRELRTLADMTAEVVQLRRCRGNLSKLLPTRSSKVSLAKELLPVLERKIKRVEASGTATKVPLVKVLERAVELAYAYPRKNLVIGTRPRLT